MRRYTAMNDRDFLIVELSDSPGRFVQVNTYWFETVDDALRHPEYAKPFAHWHNTRGPLFQLMEEFE